MPRRGTASSYGGSSVYDFNLDGYTDGLDEAVIKAHLSTDCRNTR